MDHRIFAVPVLGGLFRLAKAILITPQAEDPAAFAAAFDAAVRVLPTVTCCACFPKAASAAAAHCGRSSAA